MRLPLVGGEVVPALGAPVHEAGALHGAPHAVGIGAVLAARAPHPRQHAIGAHVLAGVILFLGYRLRKQGPGLVEMAGSL